MYSVGKVWYNAHDIGEIIMCMIQFTFFFPLSVDLLIHPFPTVLRTTKAGYFVVILKVKLEQKKYVTTCIIVYDRIWVSSLKRGYNF